MWAYVGRRAAQMVFVIFGVVTVTFFAVRLVPGDPARIMNRPGTPESVLKLTREQLGTDRPIHLQYVTFLGDLLRGDLGESFRGGRAVSSAVAEAFPARAAKAFRSGNRISPGKRDSIRSRAPPLNSSRVLHLAARSSMNSTKVAFMCRIGRVVLNLLTPMSEGSMI